MKIVQDILQTILGIVPEIPRPVSEMDFNSRPDRTSVIRQQTSRIYMTTIAANEREERLLTKKLDALDLEHRSQFVKMKKWIQYTETSTMKKFPEFAATQKSGLGQHRNSLGAVPALGLKCGFRKSFSREPNCEKESSSEGCDNENCVEHSPGPTETTLEPLVHKPLRKMNTTARMISANAFRHNTPPPDPLRYTELEVGRLRKSWAGRKTPPKRKPSFLPQLDNLPSLQAQISNERNANRKKRHSKALLWERREKTLPNIEFHNEKQISKSVEVEMPRNVTGRNVAMQRNSTVQFSSSVPNF